MGTIVDSVKDVAAQTYDIVACGDLHQVIAADTGRPITTAQPFELAVIDRDGLNHAVAAGPKAHALALGAITQDEYDSDELAFDF